MTYSINAGIAISLDQTTWYNLTDHNRQPIKVNFEVIEKTNRMADGTLRRYVIARKHKIVTNWQMVPSKTAMTVDQNKAGSWMKSFYEANVFVPVYVKVFAADLTTQPTAGAAPDEDTYYKSSWGISRNSNSPTIYQTYITNFDYEVIKRNQTYDLVNINIEFTEV